uniref:Ionotropic glutamate receptor C-terminal domain-containing protein n=1 Tax=Arion vulgaris TaxID=1028688 RepID=A0A0B6XZK1_9EUPU
MKHLCGCVLAFIICILGTTKIVQGKSLVVTSLLVQPFLVENENIINETKHVSYAGYIPDLLEQVSKLTKLSFTLSVRTDRKYGNKLPNGSWDGLIGDIVEGRADVAVGPLTETSSRSKVVDFSTPFMNFGPVIILKKPQSPVMSLLERLQRLFAPLSQSIWMMSGMAWLVTSAVLYMICHIDPYDWRRLTKDKQATLREGESFSCLNTFWFTISTILWQGYSRSPRSLGGRIVTTFWWLYVLIFIVMYFASMTNYLRVGPMQSTEDFYTNIHSIENLADQNLVNFGVIKGGATQQYLQSAKVSKIMVVWSRINQENTMVESLEEGIVKVRTSRKPFALIAESAMAKYFTKQSPCELYMVGDFITIGSYSIAFKVNTGLVKRVDIALLTLRETGVLKELEDRWFSGGCSKFIVESNNNKVKIPPFYGVDLGTFSGALIILAFGLILGSLATIIEVFVFKYAEQEDKGKSEARTPLTSSANRELPNSDPEPTTDV